MKRYHHQADLFLTDKEFSSEQKYSDFTAIAQGNPTFQTGFITTMRMRTTNTRIPHGPILPPPTTQAAALLLLSQCTRTKLVLILMRVVLINSADTWEEINVVQPMADGSHVNDYFGDESSLLLSCEDITEGEELNQYNGDSVDAAGRPKYCNRYVEDVVFEDDVDVIVWLLAEQVAESVSLSRVPYLSTSMSHQASKNL